MKPDTRPLEITERDIYSKKTGKKLCHARIIMHKKTPEEEKAWMAKVKRATAEFLIAVDQYKAEQTAKGAQT